MNLEKSLRRYREENVFNLIVDNVIHLLLSTNLTIDDIRDAVELGDYIYEQEREVEK